MRALSNSGAGTQSPAAPGQPKEGGAGREEELRMHGAAQQERGEEKT